MGRLSIDPAFNLVRVYFNSVEGSQTMPTIERLLQGLSSFRENYFENDRTLFKQLSTEGQKPFTLLIAYWDSRLGRIILFGVQRVSRYSLAMRPIWWRRMNQTLVSMKQAQRLSLRFVTLLCHKLSP